MSKIDSDKFFLNKNGKNDFEGEFNSTVEAFENDNVKAGWFDYPVECVFRERYEFIKSLGLIKKNKNFTCPDFEHWKESLNVDSLTLVFSSSYPNNPSSMFGHTLIRLNQKNKTNDLLDYSVSFSAIPDNSDNGLMFGLKGLFGGYKGFIEITKYYTKVSDYVHSESRDLLEYDLDFTPAEIDRFLNHVWEVYQTSYADYYFFDENCSSFLADLLQVSIGPEIDISKHSRWYYLPAEVVKSFDQKTNRIKNFHYRPSLKKVFNQKMDSLNSIEKKEFNEFVFGNSANDIDAKVLDAVTTYYEFKKNRNKFHLSDVDEAKFRKSLILSSKKRYEQEALKINGESKRPEEGHDPFGLSLYYSNSKINENNLGFIFKNGYHNLMDHDRGHDTFSQVDFLVLDLKYNLKNNRLDINQFKIIDLSSIHQFSFYDPRFSWNAYLGYDSKVDSNKWSHFTNFKMNMGPTFSLSKDLLLSFYLGGFAEIENIQKNGQRIGPNLENSLLWSLLDQWKLGVFQNANFNLKDSFKKSYDYQLKIKSSHAVGLNQLINVEFNQKKKEVIFGYEIHY